MYDVVEIFHRVYIKNEIIFGKSEEVTDFFILERENVWGIDNIKQFTSQIEMNKEIERIKEHKYLSKRTFTSV